MNKRMWWLLGREWDAVGLRQPGWLLMPLRAFLGITFVVAALQKLANPSFFDSSAPTSVQAQMRAIAPASPIGWLVDLGLHTGWLIGLVIALAELAVGLGTLVGLRARLAATGGALLSLTFFLTVSWNTVPYYYGADIVFLFAWTPFIAMGASGVVSLDALIAGPRAVRRTEMAPTHQMLERRAFLGVGGSAVLLAGVTAIAGRLRAGSGSAASVAAPAKQADPGRHSRRTGNHARTHRRPAGMTPITATSAVAVGQGHLFKDPATGNPAWLVRTGPESFKAFSAVCTHAGCTVDYDPSAREFVCPCHGGAYQAGTGSVVAGPPPQPLPAISVAVRTGTVYVK